jgi:hypothetical protein
LKAELESRDYWKKRKNDEAQEVRESLNKSLAGRVVLDSLANCPLSQLSSLNGREELMRLLDYKPIFISTRGDIAGAPAKIRTRPLLGLAVFQDEFGKTLSGLALDIRKRRHPHAPFLDFLNDGVLVHH